MKDSGIQPAPLEDAVCVICDYGGVIAAGLVVAIAAFFLRERWWPQLVPPVTPSAPLVVAFSTPSSGPTDTFLPVALPTATAQSTTPTVAATTTPEPFNFVIVFIPVHWQGAPEDFKAAASRQAELFLRESNLRSFAAVEVRYLADSFTEEALDSDELLPALIEFGLVREPADRYVGLTDEDLTSEGQSDVTGYTFGPGYQAVIGEAAFDELTAHELGHTFGLCDEYAYVIWLAEADDYGRCPNPYPADCPVTREVDVICDGQPAEDGRNSIMGPSGMAGDYAYNAASYSYLQQVFSQLGSDPYNLASVAP